MTQDYLIEIEMTEMKEHVLLSAFIQYLANMGLSREERTAGEEMYDEVYATHHCKLCCNPHNHCGSDSCEYSNRKELPHDNP